MASSARLDELKKKFEENPRRYFAPLANELRKSGELDQAIALCRTHLPQQPAHISGHIVLAQALFEAGVLDESRQIFHTALGLDPENLIALRYLGDIAKESADIETARSWYQRVLEVDPRNEEIVQLVRDLDAPPAPAEAAAEVADDAESSFAPAPERVSAPSPEPTPPPAPANDRFAPLSLDEVDLHEGFSTELSGGSASPNDPVSGAEADPHASWQAPDEPEIDPFDFDPDATVESLYDPATAEPEQDFFLTELAAAPAPPETTDSGIGSPPPATAPAESESWDVEPSPEPAMPEPAHAEPAASELDAFEEGDFYLEPAPEPSEPAEMPSAAASNENERYGETSAPVVQASAPVDMPGEDAFAAEYAVPADEPEETKARATGSQQAVQEPAPNVDAIQSLAEMQTAEWQPPVQETMPVAPADELGLEVMEFVPPSREPQPIAHAPEPPADPLYGHMLSSDDAAQTSATPDAFVTETMAELYLQQGFRNEALGVYRELLARNPSDTSLRDRIEQLENGSVSSIGMASVSEDVVESAIKRRQARAGRSVRSFFASLAARRAPSAYAASETDDQSSVAELAPEPSALTEPSASVAEPMDVIAPSPTPDLPRTAPLMSAAETLATFDPFADVSEPVTPVAASTETEPNAMMEWPMAEPPSAPELSMAETPSAPEPTPTAPTPSRPTPLASPALTPPSALSTGEPTAERPSLGQLFPDTPVTARTEAAAQTLATAFGRGEPQGRPTRAASNELSLDNVFRGTPEGAPPSDGGFSFDQFFSDSRSSTGEIAAPAATAPESAENGPRDAHDIEQFTAWLEGLKKK